MSRWIRLAWAAFRYGPRATFTAARAKQLGAKQKLAEFAGLVMLVRRQQPRTILEIGTLRGGSLWAWCRVASRDAVIISVDLPGGDFGGGYDLHATTQLEGYSGPEQHLHLLRADSHSPNTLAEVKRLLRGQQVEFAFIDGDHTYAGVKQDFEMYSALMAPRGLIALHDTIPHSANSGCEVDRLWAELVPQHETLEFADRSDVRFDGGWGGIGVVRVEP